MWQPAAEKVLQALVQSCLLKWHSELYTCLYMFVYYTSQLDSRYLSCYSLLAHIYSYVWSLGNTPKATETKQVMIPRTNTAWENSNFIFRDLSNLGVTDLDIAKSFPSALWNATHCWGKEWFKIGHRATFVGIDSQPYVATLHPIMVVYSSGGPKTITGT